MKRTNWVGIFFGVLWFLVLPVGGVVWAWNADSDESDGGSARGFSNEGLNSYPEWEGYDLDCADVDGPIRVGSSDPHGLDRDGDGIGCEWG